MQQWNLPWRAAFPLNPWRAFNKNGTILLSRARPVLMFLLNIGKKHQWQISPSRKSLSVMLTDKASASLRWVVQKIKDTLFQTWVHVQPTNIIIFSIVEIVLFFISKPFASCPRFDSTSYLTPWTAPCLSSQGSPLETIACTKTLELPPQTVNVENQPFLLTPHLPNVTLLILLHQPVSQLHK